MDLFYQTPFANLNLTAAVPVQLAARPLDGVHEGLAEDAAS